MSQNSGEDSKSQNASSPEILRLFACLAAYRKLIASVTFAVAAVFLLAAFLKPPIYAASATLLPHNQPVLGGLLGSFVDVTGTTPGGGELEPYYADIVTSDQVLDEALARTWTIPGKQEPQSLYTIFGVRQPDGNTNTARREVDRMKRKLRNQVIRFSTDRASGLMRLTCRIPRQPQLAADLANFLVDRLGQYAVQFRSTKAGEQRKFVEGRLHVVRAELDSATMTLAKFVEGNRYYVQSPLLQDRHDQLAREVDARTSVWAELRRQLEIAKIDERREIVTVDVLDRAIPPVKKASPIRSLYLAAGLFVGVVLSLVIVILLEFRRSMASLRPAAGRVTASDG